MEERVEQGRHCLFREIPCQAIDLVLEAQHDLLECELLGRIGLRFPL